MAPPLAANFRNVEQHRKSVLESRIELLANVKDRLKQPEAEASAMTKKSMNFADIAMPGEKTTQWQRLVTAVPPAFPKQVDMTEK